MVARSRGGAPGSAVKTSPNQLGGLYSVSCASPGNCSAVGGYRSKPGRGGDALFVTETAGRRATGVQAVLRRNAPYAAYLTSVSCTSAEHCSAAGGYQQAQGVLFGSSATPPCLVPRLEGKTLTGAKQSVRAGLGRKEPARHVAEGQEGARHLAAAQARPHPRPRSEVEFVVSTGRTD